ncbi:MAG: amino acid adenylation domain-containing protein [Singulisphaera sp.]|nr:amino acid adenylation domain-containing protein [Singulisphaera sp.]
MSTVLEDRIDLDDDLSAARPELLHELFAETAAGWRDQVAIWYRGREMTYGELDRASNRLARLLRARGVRRGDCVGLLLPRSPDIYVGLLAILKAGAAYVPLDPDYPEDRLSYILENCRAQAVVTTSEMADRHASYRGAVVALDACAAELEAESDEPLSAPETGVAPEDVCYVIYTSGTTGRPKGVQIEHRSACNLVRAEGLIFRVGPHDRVYQGFSIAFDASVEEVWLAFLAGATLVVPTREVAQSGPALARWLTEAGVTVFSTVPTLLAMIEDELPTVRILILGGEACPRDLVARWSRPGRRMVNTYGPTEATVIATYTDCDPAQPATIGRPVPGYTVHILDEAMRPVPAGEAGEIHIGGIGLARGYVGLPELTREKFVANPFSDEGDRSPRLYKTGDLGRFAPDGSIKFLGRIDTQVKLRGFRIELSEIESVLLECPGVLAGAVALREDVPGIPQLVAYIVPRDGTRIDREGTRKVLRSRLPAYMVPSRLETIDALPTLPSGKVDRQNLLAPRTQPAEAEAAGPEDENWSERERKIAAVWRKLFALAQVSVTDDFFLDLGGHSLLAARMVSELRKGLDFQGLSVLDVYQHPTIAALAAKLEQDRQAGRAGGEAEGAGSGARNPRDWFHVPSRLSYYLCAVFQAVGLYFILGFFSLQWLAPYLTYTWLIEHDTAMLEAVVALLGILVILYPVMVAVSIVVKWVIIGRYKPGRYPLWGWYYLRWWFVSSIHSVIPIGYMTGTPLLNIYLRLLGARIGTNVHLGTNNFQIYDLLTVGDDTNVGTDASLLGCTVEDGMLVIGPITVGKRCFVGNRTVVRECAVMEDDAKLEDLSLLSVGARLPGGERWSGSPARRLSRVAAAGGASAERPGVGRRVVFGFMQAIGLLVFPMLVIGAIFPGMILMNELNYQDEYYSYLVISPLVAASFVVLLCLEIAALKWLLLGRVRAGRYDLYSGFSLRKWFIDRLMELSIDILGPLYATLYLNPWYKLLGARIGRRAEISTASFISPDLLTMGDEGFIADCVSLGSARVEDGQLTVGEVKIGNRAFIGNSAVLPPGVVIGDKGLIGCLSITPTSVPGSAAPGTSWLGSPAFFLPQRQECSAFGAEATFKPSRKLYLQRAAIELARVLLPSTCFIILTSLLLSAFLLIHDEVPMFALVLLFPLLYLATGLAAALLVVVTKWVVMGRYRPCERPLWSPFVWKTELVTSMHDNFSCQFLVEMLCGTPFIVWYFRLLGAKIGKRVFMNTTEFTEFDLVEIGDDVALNADATVQTHLFEDRVMKMSTVKIGPRCSVGGMSLVLYDTRMEEGATLSDLSLLMKGEVLPAWTRWEGIPAAARPQTPPLLRNGEPTDRGNSRAVPTLRTRIHPWSEGPQGRHIAPGAGVPIRARRRG